MEKRHIAFITESAHGHINPTLGIAALLVERGYRVTYPVKECFATRVVASGAEALIYNPLQNKFKIFQEIQGNWDDVVRLQDGQLPLLREEREDTLSQLEAIYRMDRPDLTIYAGGTYVPGDTFVSKLGTLGLAYIAAAAELPQGEIIGDAYPFRDKDPALVFTPRFFCRNGETCSNRFNFVGPIYNNVRKCFRPWRPQNTSTQTILISATMGLLPQIEFFKTAIRAFEGSAFRVILSVGEEIDMTQLGPLPNNFEINQHSSQLEILERACLFVGQGGPGSTMEALYCGVPVLLIPPSPFHQFYARRAAELGVGVCLDRSHASAENLRIATNQLLNDTAAIDRVIQIGRIMRADDGASRAMTLIDGMLQSSSV